MAEYRFYPADETPHVSTAEFHADRERAPHLEQGAHQGRLRKAAEFAMDAANRWETDQDLASENYQAAVFVDLGCGDGGLLSLVEDLYKGSTFAWGYDFQSSNVPGWTDRRVEGYLLDAFNNRDLVDFGNIAIVTEVLEHLDDPHDVVRWIGEHSRFIVASSPNGETHESHDACHVWGWDMDGYRALIEQGGYTVLRHEAVDQFQVILGEQQ